jgi:CubicO group peptidase (beta-lactamase class C family)
MKASKSDNPIILLLQQSAEQKKVSLFHLMWTITTLLLLQSCAAPGERRATNVHPGVATIFSRFEVEGSPGATVMVIRDGAVLHSAGYGVADLSNGTALSPATPVRLASVSKAFTAMAIVILEERNELTFDAYVTEWVPELARFPGITVRHLLNHTSGLPDYYDDGSPLEEIAAAAERERPFQNAEAISLYKDWGKPVFSPGERFDYNNAGYEVLALIVERSSGVTFGQFLETEIFTPLKMNTAVVRDLPTTRIPDRAIGYAPSRDGVKWEESDDNWANWMVGAGGIYASTRDLYQWDQALYRWAEAGDRTDEAFVPARLNDGTESEYGFGWNLSARLGCESISHEGDWVGFRTALLRFPEQRLTVIVLSNASANVSQLAESVAALFLEEG